MTEIEIHIPPAADAKLADAKLIARIDSSIRSLGLAIGMKSTLKRFPGCTHWHVKNPDHPGTLEITYWPKMRRAWMKIAANRHADWMDRVVPKLKKSIES